MSDLDLEDETDEAHTSDGQPRRNAPDDDYDTTAAELRQFIERIEQLEGEKKEIADQIKEVFAEIKGRGYDAKVIRKVVALRKRDRDDILEENAILGIYLPALGMEDLL